MISRRFVLWESLGETGATHRLAAPAAAVANILGDGELVTCQEPLERQPGVGQPGLTSTAAQLLERQTGPRESSFRMVDLCFGVAAAGWQRPLASDEPVQSPVTAFDSLARKASTAPRGLGLGRRPRGPTRCPPYSIPVQVPGTSQQPQLKTTTKPRTGTRYRYTYRYLYPGTCTRAPKSLGRTGSYILYT